MIYGFTVGGEGSLGRTSTLNSSLHPVDSRTADTVYYCVSYNVQRTVVDKKNQLDVTFCVLYFSSNSCSTCFGQSCAHHQELNPA